jgi:hypothetical protein
LSWRLRLPDSLCQFQLPLLDYSVLFLLRLMDISTILMAISSILTGKSIVIHSSQVFPAFFPAVFHFLNFFIEQLSLLLPVCECLLSLIFPFRWTNVYVPVLPRGILQVCGTISPRMSHPLHLGPRQSRSLYSRHTFRQFKIRPTR